MRRKSRNATIVKITLPTAWMMIPISIRWVAVVVEVPLICAFAAFPPPRPWIVRAIMSNVEKTMMYQIGFHRAFLGPTITALHRIRNFRIADGRELEKEGVQVGKSEIEAAGEECWSKDETTDLKDEIDIFCDIEGRSNSSNVSQYFTFMANVLADIQMNIRRRYYLFRRDRRQD